VKYFVSVDNETDIKRGPGAARRGEGEMLKRGVCWESNLKASCEITVWLYPFGSAD
jgi:hypothetical protein